MLLCCENGKSLCCERICYIPNSIAQIPVPRKVRTDLTKTYDVVSYRFRCRAHGAGWGRWELNIVFQQKLI